MSTTSQALSSPAFQVSGYVHTLTLTPKQHATIQRAVELVVAGDEHHTLAEYVGLAGHDVDEVHAVALGNALALIDHLVAVVDELVVGGCALETPVAGDR